MLRHTVWCQARVKIVINVTDENHVIHYEQSCQIFHKAQMHQWTIDMVSGTASFVQLPLRQIHPMEPRLNVKPIAKEIADAIVSEQKDERLKWFDDGRVRIEIGKVIPEGYLAKQTIQGRRKRFRNELEMLLANHGWVPTRGANTYVRES